MGRKIYCFGEGTSAQFIHFKVHNGGHQWFGSVTANSNIGYLGLNNHDINANEELIEFFLQYRLSDFINDILLGDVNDDGNINVADIVIIVSIILSEIEVTENQLVTGDINSDSIINVIDIVMLIDIIIN